MTVPQILDDLKPVKRMSRKTLYVYFNRFGIKPLGQVRQSPQQYPDNAPIIIRVKLGLPTTPAKKNGRNKAAVKLGTKRGGAR